MKAKDAQTSTHHPQCAMALLKMLYNHIQFYLSNAKNAAYETKQ